MNNQNNISTRRQYCFNLRANIFCLAISISLCICDPSNGQSYLPPRLVQRLSELKRENRFDEAITLLDLQLDTIKLKPDQRAIFEIKLQKADIYRMKGQGGKALTELDSLLERYSHLFPVNDPLFAELLTVKGTFFLTRGELMKGRASIEEAIKIYTINFGKEDTLLGPCYNKLGNYYYFSKIYDSALAFYSKALELAGRKRCNLEDRASYIQNIGIIQLELSNYSEAEACFLESLRLKESIYSPNSFSLGRLYLNLGRFYQGISALDKAFFYIEKAEKIYSSEECTSRSRIGKYLLE